MMPRVIRRPARVPKVAALLALAVAGAVAAPSALACKCIPPSAATVKGADVVFTGTVTARSDPAAGQPSQGSIDPITFTLAVEKELKGDVDATAQVVTPRQSASCGVDFQVGARFLVVAHRDGIRAQDRALRRHAGARGERPAAGVRPRPRRRAGPQGDGARAEGDRPGPGAPAPREPVAGRPDRGPRPAARWRRACARPGEERGARGSERRRDPRRTARRRSVPGRGQGGDARRPELPGDARPGDPALRRLSGA